VGSGHQRRLKRLERRDLRDQRLTHLFLLGSAVTVVGALFVFFLWIPPAWQNIVSRNGLYLYPYAILAFFLSSLLFTQRTVLRKLWFWRDVAIWVAVHCGLLMLYWRSSEKYPSYGVFLLWTAIGFMVTSFTIEFHKRGGNLFLLLKAFFNDHVPIHEEDLAKIKKWRADGPPTRK
jgi:hypothetical protein